jgi:signal peptidase I
MLSRWASLSGTARRREAWAWAVTLVLGVSLFLTLNEGATPLAAGPRLALVFALSIVVVGANAAIIRRIHDTGRSGWWGLTLAVPSVRIAPLLFFLLARARHAPPDRFAPALRYRIGAALLLLLGAALLSRAFWAPYWAPSINMRPTLLIGDYFVASLGAAPERGDVMIFRHPVNGQDLISRLIGLPGDRIAMQGGVLSINDEPARQDPDGQFVEAFEKQGRAGALPKCRNLSPALGADCLKDRFVETLPGGARHAILNLGDGPLDDTPVYTVPRGHSFFLGYNRDDSTDSRIQQASGGVGFVPRENLVGRVNRVIFSSAGRSLDSVWTWRGDRFFRAVE